MHILIIEAALTGHHSGYLERIAEAFLEHGHVVTCTVLQKDGEHPAIERLRATYAEAFRVQLIDDASYTAAVQSPLGEPGRELALRLLFGRAYAEVNQRDSVGYVFLPYLDYCLYALGMLGPPFGGTAWGGICMRPSFHYELYGVLAPRPKMAFIKRALFLRLLRSKTLKSVYTIDELLNRFVVERHNRWARRLQYVPDPAELKGNHTHASARSSLGIPDDAAVVLVYGAIDERKGLDVLAEAAGGPEVPKTLHLLIAGRQSAGVRTLMNSDKMEGLTQAGRCHVINEFVDASVEQKVFAAADIVWLGYRNHYSMSGVLVLAALSGKTILGTHQGLIGWYIREKNLGSAVDTADAHAVQVELLQLLASAHTNPARQASSAAFEDFTWSRFNKTLVSAIA